MRQKLLTQDNNDPWQTLAAATAKLLSKIDEQQDKQTGGEGDADRGDEQKRKAQSDYVAQRVRDIRAFERRVSGNKN